MLQKPTAYHEAGHAVAAWSLGAGPRAVTIVPHGADQGQVTHEDPLSGIQLDFDGSDRARTRAERAIMICLAGPVAQRRFAPRSWRRWHGASDYVTAVDLARRINHSARAADAHLKWLDIRTEDLIESLWGPVERVAAELLAHGTLAPDEIRLLLSATGGRQGQEQPKSV
jgi:hypothetical protein